MSEAGISDAARERFHLATSCKEWQRMRNASESRHYRATSKSCMRSNCIMVDTEIILGTVLTLVLLICIIVLSLYLYYYRDQSDSISSDIETAIASNSSSTLSQYPLQLTYSFQGSEVLLVQQKYINL